MSTTSTRQQISTALLALLSTAYAFKYTSRRFRNAADQSQVQQPALFLVKHKEQHVKQKLVTPAIRHLYFDAYIFIATGTDQNSTPMDTLDTLIDAIDPVSGGVLAPPAGFAYQTLGGLAVDCFIDGDITLVPGDLDGQGLAVIPIKVIHM